MQEICAEASNSTDSSVTEPISNEKITEEDRNIRQTMKTLIAQDNSRLRGFLLEKLTVRQLRNLIAVYIATKVTFSFF